MINQKKAAMEMSVGTVVTIVLLMTVLALGIVLVQKIFTGATESVDSINDQIRGEIDNLFNTEDEELVINLGSKHIANVKQGTDDFGFSFGFSPNDPSLLSTATYSIIVQDPSGNQYCSGSSSTYTAPQIRKWFIGGINNLQFDRTTPSAVYGLIQVKIPEDMAVCSQKFKIEIDGELYENYFVIKVIKKGFI